ncbi:MAG: YhbY family RNA-binding protein [Oscillospiraceae bacterium]|jgi:RNA-binding protein|nr:YhbY family RNA-binding protein [Oscillospiraceae bacterium]
MDSKTRAALKSQANALPALYQIGKEGVTAAVCAQVLEGFNTRELMKVKCLLKTLPGTVREAADAIAEGTGAEVVQTVGGSIILYRYNPELHNKDKPKRKTVKGTKARVKSKTRGDAAESVVRAASAIRTGSRPRSTSAARTGTGKQSRPGEKPRSARTFQRKTKTEPR